MGNLFSSCARTSLFVACTLAGVQNLRAADIVFVDNANEQTATRQQVESAAKFYGLTLETRVIGYKQQRELLQSLRSPDLLAVIADARVLPMLDRSAFIGSLKRHERSIPLLIAGINEGTKGDCLKQWSAGRIVGAARASSPGEKYLVASTNDITRQLRGIRVPLPSRDVVYLTAIGTDGPQEILNANIGTAAFPVLARTQTGDADIFFASWIEADDTPPTADPYHQMTMFAHLAAPMLFLRYAAGEHAWHSPGPYANFTIDDAWLREPYGHVNYEGLLQNATSHNFHATIAFIPWNFDRSQPDVAALFRQHPERLSICVHGNDHVHQEFGPLDSHPLDQQVKNMRQGLARMDRFTALTRVGFDPVMVFPHSIAPEATFSELRRNHYLATANSLNVPSDMAAPAGADFALRTATLQFGDFPSLRRYSAETDIPRAQLAIDAFLGNPMLFYAHESFFASGIDAFNSTADSVNQIQPGMQWQSLGVIARHLYLEKLRDDGNYDIRAFSPEIQIKNNHQRDAVYLIEKDEDFSEPLSVQIDGTPVSFEREGSHLRLKVPIQSGAERSITIRYDGGSGMGNVDIAKTSLRTNAIRLLSDFRDNTVSRTKMGRLFINSYKDNGRYWNLGMVLAAGLLLLWCVFRTVRTRHRLSSIGRQIPSV